MTNGPVFSRRKPTPSQSPVASFESMEPRLMMSGSVWASVVRGSLVVRGDAASNHVVIDQSGLAPGQFRITGQDGTTINGQAAVVLSSVTRDVNVRLGEGIDVIEMTDVAVSHDLIVHGGHSGDTLSITDGAVGRNVIVDAGQGDNTLNIDGTAISGRLTFSATWGVDTLNMSNDASVAGQVNFQPGRGENTCSVNGVSIGSLTIDGRHGPSHVGVVQSTIQGRMSVVTGSDVDNIRIDHGTLKGNLKIDTHAGADRVEIENSSFENNALFNTGSGNDQMYVETEASGDPGTVFSGYTRMLLGAGTDSVVLSPNNLQDPITFGRTFIDGGRGRNQAFTGSGAHWTGDHGQKMSHMEYGGDSVIVTPGQLPHMPTLPSHCLYDGPLTGPSDDLPINIVMDYLKSHASQFGAVSADFDDMVVTSQYTSGGTTHIYLRQAYNGNEVANTDLSISLDSDGRIQSIAGRVVPHVASAEGGTDALLTPEQAILFAAATLGVTPVYSADEISIDATGYYAPKLEYIASPQGKLTLVWYVHFGTGTGLFQPQYDAYVDAVTGTLIAAYDNLIEG